MYFPENLKVNARQLKYKLNGDMMTLSWPRIRGYHSDVSVMQCDAMKTSCLSYDVTNVTQLNVASTNGSLLTMIVKQGSDVVFIHQFTAASQQTIGK